MGKNKKILGSLFLAFLIIGLIFGVIAYRNAATKIAIDNASVSAPTINLTTKTGGVLNAEYVNVGDIVSANTVVTEVGSELIKTESAGQVLSVSQNIGSTITPGQTVATLVDPSALQIVGQVPENKGLSDIKVGQIAYFTVDAYGSKQFYGTVSEISPAATVGALTFNISDKRTVQNFNVKVRYNTSQYSELKNGMSARIWILK